MFPLLVLKLKHYKARKHLQFTLAMATLDMAASSPNIRAMSSHMLSMPRIVPSVPLSSRPLPSMLWALLSSSRFFRHLHSSLLRRTLKARSIHSTIARGALRATCFTIPLQVAQHLHHQLHDATTDPPPPPYDRVNMYQLMTSRRGI